MPTDRKVGIAGRTETAERSEKIGRSEAVERPEKVESSDTVARLRKIERPEAVARLEKTERSEAVARLETDKMRIYWKADPPEGREGGRQRIASKWYRTCCPDRVLPREAVIP